MLWLNMWEWFKVIGLVIAGQGHTDAAVSALWGLRQGQHRLRFKVTVQTRPERTGAGRTRSDRDGVDLPVGKVLHPSRRTRGCQLSDVLRCCLRHGGLRVEASITEQETSSIKTRHKNNWSRWHTCFCWILDLRLTMLLSINIVFLHLLQHHNSIEWQFASTALPKMLNLNVMILVIYCYGVCKVYVLTSVAAIF